MHFGTILSLGLLSMSALACSNNCKGSSDSPSITDCQAALRNIDTSATYADQAEFTVDNCYVVYATNGSGEQRLSGQKNYDTAKTILDTCGHHKGSMAPTTATRAMLRSTIALRRSFDSGDGSRA